VSAAELALIPVIVAGAGFGGFAAARLRQARPSGRHPGFAGRPAGDPGPRRRPGPQQGWPAPARRRPRRGGRITVTAATAAGAWAALAVYAHMTGYGPLVIALITAVVTWSRIRPKKARRRA
jgi:hypothetical protein